MQELLGDVEAEILRAEERLRRSVWPLSEEKQSAGAGDYHASGVTITSSRSRIYAPQSEVPERLACAEDREGFLSQILSRERQPMVDTHTCLYGEAQPGPARVPPGPSATSGTTSSVAAPPPPARLCDKYIRGVRRESEQPLPPPPPPEIHPTETIMTENIRRQHPRLSKQKPDLERINVLAKDRSETLKEREREKARREAEEAAKFSYAPSRYTRCSRIKSPTARPVHERLLQQKKERDEQFAAKVAMKDKAASSACPFRPKLIAKQRGERGRVPIYERVWQVQRDREMRKREREELSQSQKSSEMPFRPTIPVVSENLVRSSTDVTLDVGKRLSEESDRRAMRRLDLQLKAEESEARASPFAPRLSRGTRHLISSHPELAAPFEKRQAILEARSREKEMQRQRDIELEQSGWFTPQVSRTKLQISRNLAAEEDEAKKWTRMSTGEAQAREARQAQSRRQADAALTFTPKIAPGSRRLGSKQGGAPHTPGRRMDRAKRAAKERWKEACPFKPHLIAEECGIWREHAGEGDSPYGSSNRFRMPIRQPSLILEEEEARLKERERRAAQAKSAKEVEEMQACTFAPKTLRGKVPPGPAGPVVIQGLGRHLETKDAARRMRESQRAREEIAFCEGPRAQERLSKLRDATGQTITIPFRLSTGFSNKWEARKQVIAQENAVECSFIPRTLEHERKLILDQMLQDGVVLPGGAGKGDEA